ncbi:hypothetical protein KAI87_04250 [Myxococcota bacterium]|nr:hypothetical protein [Myxococcota bacterium]
MKNFLEKYAGSKSIALLFGLFLLFNIVLFPALFPSGAQSEPIDLQFAYTPQTAYQLIENYGDDTRHTYLIGELTVDAAYPIIYSLLLSFILFVLFKNHKLALAPFLILFADYGENLGIVIMLWTWPQKLVSVAWVTSFFTTLKWILVLGVVTMILVGALKWVRAMFYRAFDC